MACLETGCLPSRLFWERVSIRDKSAPSGKRQEQQRRDLLLQLGITKWAAGKKVQIAANLSEGIYAKTPETANAYENR